MKYLLLLLAFFLGHQVMAQGIDVLYRNTSQLMGNLYSEKGFDMNAEQKRLKASLAAYEAFSEKCPAKMSGS